MNSEQDNMYQVKCRGAMIERKLMHPLIRISFQNYSTLLLQGRFAYE